MTSSQRSEGELSGCNFRHLYNVNYRSPKESFSWFRIKVFTDSRKMSTLRNAIWIHAAKVTGWNQTMSLNLSTWVAHSYIICQELNAQTWINENYLICLTTIQNAFKWIQQRNREAANKHIEKAELIIEIIWIIWSSEFVFFRFEFWFSLREIKRLEVFSCLKKNCSWKPSYCSG